MGVDRLGWGESGECKEPTVEIGVVAQGYTDWDRAMSLRPHAWCYESDGEISHAGEFAESVESGDLPELSAGSTVTVTLRNGTVTFAHVGSEVHSFVLPKDCGRISLGVCMHGDD